MFTNSFVNSVPCWSVRKVLYKVLGMEIGKGSRIGYKTIIVNPRGISLGKNVIVNEFCHLDGRGGLLIGDNTSISVYSKIITATHDSESASFDYLKNEVRIGKNVWMGCNAIILDGATVEDGCIIGAGCVFKGVSRKNEVYIGNPAKLAKIRDLKEEYSIDYKPYFR